jgi:hypothetical protein
MIFFAPFAKIMAIVETNVGIWQRLGARSRVFGFNAKVSANLAKTVITVMSGVVLLSLLAPLLAPQFLLLSVRVLVIWTHLVCQIHLRRHQVGAALMVGAELILCRRLSLLLLMMRVIRLFTSTLFLAAKSFQIFSVF